MQWEIDNIQINISWLLSLYTFIFICKKCITALPPTNMFIYKIYTSKVCCYEKGRILLHLCLYLPCSWCVFVLLIIKLHNMANRRCHYQCILFALFADNMIIYCPLGLDGENFVCSVHCPFFFWSKFHLTDPQHISL